MGNQLYQLIKDLFLIARWH